MSQMSNGSDMHIGILILKLYIMYFYPQCLFLLLLHPHPPTTPALHPSPVRLAAEVFTDWWLLGGGGGVEILEVKCCDVVCICVCACVHAAVWARVRYM